MNKIIQAIFLASFLLISFTAEAQLLLAKRLFYLSIENNPQQQGHLSFIDYNWGGIYPVDSLLYNDFSIYEDKITAAGNGVNIYQVPALALQGMVHYWQTGQNAWKALYDPGWMGALVYSIDTPYLQRSSYFGLLETLDTSKVPSGIIDMLIYNNNAYLLYSDHVRIVELNPLSLDTVLQTPTPFPFGGYNQWLVHVEDLTGADHIYIIIEYATGAPRSSMIELNPANNTFDTVYHREGLMNYYPPLVANGKVYMMHFNTHYDPLQDSLFISNFPFHPFIYAVGYCDIDNSFYLFNTVNRAVYEADFNGVIYDSVMLNKDVKRFGFWYDVIGNVDETGDMPQKAWVYAVPGGMEIRADNIFIESISIYDLSGRLVKQQDIARQLSAHYFPFSGNGIYLISMKTSEGIIGMKIVF